MILSLRLMNVYATVNDFTLGIIGELSPGGFGRTPFGPFLIRFPTAVGNHMMEVPINDYTINSLLYWLRR